MIRVALVDDQAMVRTGLARILSPADGFEVVAECADGGQAVAELPALRPDVVLMDIRMRVLDGIAATVQLRRAADTIAVLVLPRSSAEVARVARTLGTDPGIARVSLPPASGRSAAVSHDGRQVLVAATLRAGRATAMSSSASRTRSRGTTQWRSAGRRSRADRRVPRRRAPSRREHEEKPDRAGQRSRRSRRAAHDRSDRRHPRARLPRRQPHGTVGVHRSERS